MNIFVRYVIIVLKKMIKILTPRLKKYFMLKLSAYFNYKFITKFIFIQQLKILSLNNHNKYIIIYNLYYLFIFKTVDHI